MKTTAVISMGCGLALALFALAAGRDGAAEENAANKPFDPADVVALAVYSGDPDKGYQDIRGLKAEQVRFEVTDAAAIAAALAAIDLEHPLHAKLAMLPHAVVFLKFKDGAVRKAHLLDDYRYFDLVGDPFYTYRVRSREPLAKLARTLP
ncbi:MAG: hypothetical protein KatS3mg102_0390 [Planctomycetota bacterium]|nr:MAG: hypothetical protein KatS3mg102_0390 [Planctomycetota bacterium]